MTDMSIDYLNALQTALYNRLKAQIGRQAQVFQHVPDGTPPPVVIIGDLTPEDQGVKGAVFDRWSISIQVITKGPQKKPCTALQAVVRGALDRWTPTMAGGVRFGMLYQENATATLLPDDEIYFGTQIFTATTEAA